MENNCCLCETCFHKKVCRDERFTLTYSNNFKIPFDCKNYAPENRVIISPIDIGPKDLITVKFDEIGKPEQILEMFKRPGGKRLSRDEYFIEIAKVAAKRSTCLSEPKGAVIVKEKRVIATGYSGSPSGTVNCCDVGECYKRALGYGHGEGHEYCLAVHAEANALIQIAKLGVGCNGGTMYCTHEPCENCAKLIINAGIKKVYFAKEYPSSITNDLFKKAGIEIEKIQMNT